MASHVKSEDATSQHSSGTSARGGELGSDLPPGVSPNWACPLCTRSRTSINKVPLKRKCKFLPFTKPLKDYSLCLSCHNYSRGACKGFSVAEIKASLDASGEKRNHWKANIEAYEADLESSVGDRVSRQASKYSPPTIIKAFTTSEHSAKLVLPNFWPEEVYVRIKGEDLPEELRSTYTYKGKDLVGAYLDPLQHPPAAGVIIRSDVERSGVEKEQTLGSSDTAPSKKHLSELWQKAQASTSRSATTEKLESGTVKHGVKVTKRSLKRLESGSGTRVRAQHIVATFSRGTCV